MLGIGLQSQTNMEKKLPYYEIPDYPNEFTAGSVAARLIDGLGFRYYWATESLRDEDLVFKPNDSGRSIEETINHIYGLSAITVNATLGKVNNSTGENSEISFEEKREKTLNNFKTAAEILRNSKDISEYKIVFGSNEFPFWNAINGPIADALWHCGQVVLLRRSSGNPFSSKVSVFTGKVKD